MVLMAGKKQFARRLVCLCVGVLCLLFLPRQASAQTETAGQTTCVRSSASYSSGVIGLLEDGANVTVLGRMGAFYQIDCYDMDGYVATSQVAQDDNGKYYVNCNQASSETRQMQYMPYAQVLALRFGLILEARQHLGTPYVYGGARPGAFDCSGFTSYVYGQNGTPIHRTASQQLQDGLIVAKEGLQAGDLVFFREEPTTFLATHVGIYIGGGRILHAGSRGIGYGNLDGAYFKDYYLCARRIVNPQISQTALPPLTVNSISGRQVS